MSYEKHTKNVNETGSQCSRLVRVGGWECAAKPGLSGTVVRLQTPRRVARGLGGGNWDHELSRTSVFKRARFGGKEVPGGSTERTPPSWHGGSLDTGRRWKGARTRPRGRCWPRTQSRHLILISARGRGSTVSICFLI